VAWLLRRGGAEMLWAQARTPSDSFETALEVRVALPNGSSLLHGVRLALQTRHSTSGCRVDAGPKDRSDLCRKESMRSAPPLTTPASPSARAIMIPASESVLPPGALPRMLPFPGELVGRYRLVLELASGGMASVYVALADQRAGAHRVVAVKRLHTHLAHDPTYREMFLDEARIASQIRHPNVCAVFDYGAHDGTPHIVMEYLDGEPVSAIWSALPRGASASETRRRTAVLARIVVDTCEALHAAHELRSIDGEPLDVVHRDVSPENLVVTYDGVVKLCDFGIAIAKEQEHRTETGLLKGKYAYIQPEVLRGQRPDRRSDLWSLGVVLWELLTGERLFRRASVLETLQAVGEALVPAPSSVLDGVPREFDDVVFKALSPNPDERFQTAREFGKALDSAVTSAGKSASLGEVSEWMAELFEGGRASRERLVELVARRYDPAIGGDDPWGDRSSRNDEDPPILTIDSRPTIPPVVFSRTPRPFERLSAALPHPSWSRPLIAFALGALLTVELLRGSSAATSDRHTAGAAFITTSMRSRAGPAGELSRARGALETGMIREVLTEGRKGAAGEGEPMEAAQETVSGNESSRGAEQAPPERRHHALQGAPLTSDHPGRAGAFAAREPTPWRRFVRPLELTPAFSAYALGHPLPPDFAARRIAGGWPRPSTASPSKSSSRFSISVADIAFADVLDPSGSW
jgi:serine/threonine protein kinase